MRRTLGIALLAALGGAGCSDNPPPATPPQPVAVAAAPPAAPPVDLSPVPEPADIVVTARWKNPDATLVGLSTCAGIPAQVADASARQLVDRALANVFDGGVDGKQIGEAVALDAPVDLVVSLEQGKRGQPHALYAFSIPLTSLDRVKGALAAAGPLVELVPGLWRVGAKDAGELSCGIGPAAGSAPARLICGRRDGDVAALGPYLARDVPVTPPPAQDLHAELRFVPIEARYGADIRRALAFLPTAARTQSIGEPRFDKALEDAAGALADEGAALVSDLDRVTVDLGVDAGSCLTATSSLQLRGQTSWLAGTLAESGASAGPPPAIFWRAPRDADSVTYSRAGDVTRYNGIFRTLREMLAGKLAQEKIGSDADRAALAALIASPLHRGTSMVFASGHAPAAAPAAADPQQMVDGLLNGYLGWSVIGVDEGPEALSKLLKDAVAAYGRKSLVDPLRAVLGGEAEMLPVAKLGPGPAALGRGALDLELRFQIEKRAKVKFAVHVLLMPDGKSATWIAIGPDRDALVKRLLASKSGAPDGGTVASRPGLEPLRSGSAVGGGFVTLAMLTRTVASLANSPAAGKSAKLAELANAFGSMPHHGDTPIFVTSKVLPGPGPRAEVTVQMQKGSFEDLGSIVLAALRIATNAAPMAPAPRP